MTFMRLFEAIPQMLANSGLEVVFGLPGSSNIAWVAHGIRSGVLKYVGTRHEGAAVTAAGAFSKATGKVGVATTTLGPGFANTVNSMAALMHDHVPVLFIAGHSPNAKGGGDIQQLNQREICAALGVGYHEVKDPGELQDRYWEAMEAAQWNGSLHVLAIDEGATDAEVSLTDRRAPERRTPDEPDRDAVTAVVDLLSKAQSPLIIAGRGAASSGCRPEILQLADLVGARLATTLAITNYFSGHPRDLGVCGRSSSPAAAQAIYDTDVVLAIGASLSYYTTLGGGMFPQAEIVQCEIDIDRDFRASAAEYGLLADARASVRALTNEWNARGLAPRTSTAAVPTREQIRESMLKPDIGCDGTRGLDPREVFIYLDDALPEDRVIVTDGGRAILTLPALLHARDHLSYVTSRGYGSIGLGIGASIGAATACPDRRVVMCCGDGGFAMSSQDLDVIRAYGLDVLIVVMNDGQYGSEVKYLQRSGLSPQYASYSMPDVELLAQAYGGRGIVVKTMDDLHSVDLAAKGLVILDVRIDPGADATNI